MAKMVDQRELWNDQFRNPTMFRQIHADKPSRLVTDFLHWLKYDGSIIYSSGDTFVLDIGCGAGRNSLYAAGDEGYLTVGYDFSPEALAIAEKRAGGRPLVGKPAFHEVDISKSPWPWPYRIRPRVVLDCNTTVCIPNPGRDTAISEARNLLVDRGFYLFYGPKRSSFVDTEPGPEEGSTVFPNGKFERQYDTDELELVFAEHGFKLFKPIEEIPASSNVEGHEHAFLMLAAIFRKTGKR